MPDSCAKWVAAWWPKMSFRSGGDGSGPVRRVSARGSSCDGSESDRRGSVGLVVRCPKGHGLEKKVVAGSWVQSNKRCSRCNTELPSGVLRHSCKSCGYHLCFGCQAVLFEEQSREQIMLSVYRAPRPGVEDDVLQVPMERGASAGALKRRIEGLYGLPCASQVLRRDIDGEPLADDELLAYDDGDVVHLSLAGPSLTAGGAPPIFTMLPDGLAAAVAGAMAEATELSAALQESLADTTYNISFVKSSNEPRGDEQRCVVEVSAVARVQEVLEVVKLELEDESEALYLEFAGQALPPEAPIHLVGLRDGDTVLVCTARHVNVPRGGA